MHDKTTRRLVFRYRVAYLTLWRIEDLLCPSRWILIVALLRWWLSERRIYKTLVSWLREEVIDNDRPQPTSCLRMEIISRSGSPRPSDMLCPNRILHSSCESPERSHPPFTSILKSSLAQEKHISQSIAPYACPNEKQPFWEFRWTPHGWCHTGYRTGVKHKRDEPRQGFSAWFMLLQGHLICPND
jgi:hypothetical protein